MKYLKIFSVFVVILIGARVALPYALMRYAENRINRIPEYRVTIADLDVHLYRGSYTIKNIKLQRINKNIPVPFFEAKKVDLSVQWKALLHGSFVAKIITDEPVINFVMDAKGQQEQLTIDKEWQQAVKSLFPLNINTVEARHGKVALRNFNGSPPFNLYLKDVNLKLTNMQSILHKNETLSSRFSGTAKTIDGADVSVTGKYNPFTKQPTFKLAASLKGMQIKPANNFLRHFTKIDVDKGRFSLFVEVAAANGNISGYAKPIVKDLAILNPKKDTGPIEFLYKGALELLSKVVTNSQKDTIATKIKLSGRIDDPDTSTLSIIGYLLRHAFIQALLPQIDHDVEMRDVMYG